MKLFSKKHTDLTHLGNDAETQQTIERHKAQLEEKVLQAMARMGRPCTSLYISKKLEKTESLSEELLVRLVRQGRIKEVDRKLGLDGKVRGHYVLG